MVNHTLIDREKLLELVDNDHELADKLAGLYFQQLAQILLGLKAASESKDNELLLSLAHKLKGSSQTICCSSLAKTASQLEEHIKSNQFDLVFIEHVINLIEQASL